MADEQQFNPQPDQTGDLPPPTNLPKTYGLPEGSATAAKTTWPEVVGLTAEEAEKKIKQDKPRVKKIQVIPPDSFVTMDFRTDRVRIHVDSSGKVTRPPRIG